MIDVKAVLDEIVTELRDNGVRANVDPQKVGAALPAAWVTATQIDHNILGGGATITVEVWLIAPDRHDGEIWRTLSALYAKAQHAVDPTEPTRTNEALKLSDAQPMPAFVITTTRETC